MTRQVHRSCTQTGDSGLNGRERDLEAGVSRFAGDADATVVGLDNGSDDRQPETGAAPMTTATDNGPGEAFEDVVDHSRVDPGTVIGDSDPDLLRTGIDPGVRPWFRPGCGRGHWPTG